SSAASASRRNQMTGRSEPDTISTDVRKFQQALQIVQETPRIVAGIVAHHEVAQRIDDEECVLACVSRKRIEEALRILVRGIENHHPCMLTLGPCTVPAAFR